jgi:hypothetical protein
MKKVWIIVVVSALACALAPAQEKPQDMEEQKAMAAYMAANAVNENHEFLNKFAGNWDVQMTSWMAPGKPPVQERATAQAELRFDGRFLFLSFQGKMMGMPFTGLQILGYDNMKKMYVTLWMDNSSTHIFKTTGMREGNVITETGKWPDPVMGKEMGVKARTTFLNDDEYLYEQFMVQDDGKEFKSLELRCLRKK